MLINRMIIQATCFLACALPAFAADKMRVELLPGAEGSDEVAGLYYTDAACEEECESYTLACERTGSLIVTIPGLEDKQLAGFFAMSKPTITLIANGQSTELSIQRLQFQEMYGDWTMSARYSGQEFWQNFLRTSKALQIKTGKITANLPATKDMKAFIAQCGDVPQ